MTMWDELFRPLEQIDFVPATNIVKRTTNLLWSWPSRDIQKIN